MWRKLTLIVVFSFFLSGCNLLSAFKAGQKSGLQITSTPQVTVFLNGNSLGITPILEEDLKPGVYTIKLSPSDNAIQPWETQITLTPGVLTVIDRKLSAAFDQSNGYTLSFEKLTDKSSKLAITTNPDSVTVTVDGNPQGFTPVSVDNLTQGDHTILLTSPGYEDKTIRARTIQGYTLTINAQLAKKTALPVLGLDTDATASATPSAQPIPTTIAKTTPKVTPRVTPTPTLKPTGTATSSAVPKPYVEIDSTSCTGNDPKTCGANIRKGQTAPDTSPEGKYRWAYNGEQFHYLGVKSADGNYYKVDYNGQTGWIHQGYSKLVQ